MTTNTDGNVIHVEFRKPKPRLELSVILQVLYADEFVVLTRLIFPGGSRIIHLMNVFEPHDGPARAS